MELKPLAVSTQKTPQMDINQREYPPYWGQYERIYTSLDDYPSPNEHPESTIQPMSQSTIGHAALSTARPQSFSRSSTPDLAHSYSWWKDIRRNTPQSISMAASTVISMSGGMSLAYSFGLETHFKNLSKIAFLHMHCCWFVGVIIGACIAAIFIEKMTMRVSNIVASILVMINGILFISVQESAIIASIARYCDGIAFGMTLLPAIVTGSEQAVKQVRGSILSFEYLGLAVGITSYMCTKNFPTMNESYPKSTHGFLALTYGAATLGFTSTYTMESPVSYLRKDEVGAIPTLCWLQKPRNVTNETYALLKENKCLVEEDIARGGTVNILIGLMPMIKLCLLRALATISFSLPFTFVLKGVHTFHEPYVFAVMLLIGVLLAASTLDALGRKTVGATSLFVGGALLLGIGIYGRLSVDGELNVVDIGKGRNIGWMLMSYQVLAGLTVPVSTCYLGEAFSISVKPYFILVAIIFENVIQIIFCYLFSEEESSQSLFVYLFALGTVQIAFVIIFVFGLPETKKTTLREALAKFAKKADTEDRV